MAARSGLKVYNSITKSKEDFVPHREGRVGWYICGPTVYDASHMGHARNYVTFDIVRRILEDYFGYQVFAVMNVTDIDDKIIVRARRNHLFEEYTAKVKSGGANLKTDLVEAVRAFDFPTKKEGLEKKLALKATDVETKAKLRMLEERRVAVENAAVLLNGEYVLSDILDATREVLVEWLDGLFGKDVSDHSIFQRLATKYEKEFMEDMGALGVRPPDVLTRVSEYVPEIVKYIQGIEERGYAYNGDHSVYFSTQDFIKGGHQYCKLLGNTQGDTEAAAEGEGALSQFQTDKRSPLDFALWKKSKPGEPVWESPWGPGRPGWHIECSAMASDVLGAVVDMHLGGEDLKFPHHDNELAQSEAFYNSQEWVKYFLHSGHLHIDGMKMSKSLKNFVTIREELAKGTTPVQIRYFFLLHPWRSGVDYSDSGLRGVKTTEKTFKEFFMNVEARVQQATGDSERWDAAEKDLYVKFTEAQAGVDAALKDSFDTPGAIEQLRTLVRDVNIYMDRAVVRSYLLNTIATFVAKILKIFGVFEERKEGQDVATTVKPILKAMSDFRDDVRRVAREGANKDALLQLSDNLRDEVLPNVGVRLEDVTGQSAKIKLDDRDTLLRERDERRAVAEGKARQKEQARLQREQQEAEKREKARMRPEDMFRAQPDKYSQFDQSGLPTHSAEGKEISETQKKKLIKEREKQRELREKLGVTD